MAEAALVEARLAAGARIPPPGQNELEIPAFALNYARNVVRDRWPAGEPVLKKDLKYWGFYLEFLKDVNPEAWHDAQMEHGIWEPSKEA